jgi:hypothetical protein
MVWFAAALLAGAFGLIGTGWYAPVAISVLAGAVVTIDSIDANEFAPKSATMLALVVAATFLVWGVGRAARRFFLSADRSP